MVKPHWKIFLRVVAFLSIFFLNQSMAIAKPVLTLEQARDMAGTQSLDLKLVDLGYEKAVLTLDSRRNDFGFGSAHDSKTINANIELLEDGINERLNAISILESSIDRWQLELEELQKSALAGENIEIEELKIKINDAAGDIAIYQREIYELRGVNVMLVPQYQVLKTLEDQAKPALEPLEKVVEAAGDAQLLQPKTIEYYVEETYFSLLTIDSEKSYQQKVRENLENILSIEQLKMDLGLSTALSRQKIEANIRQADELARSLENNEAQLLRMLKNLLGLPLDFEFNLEPVNIDANEQENTQITLPDLTESIKYLRANHSLNKKNEDLADLNAGKDSSEYRLAELDIEEAKIQLAKLLFELKANLLAQEERWQLAEKTVEDAALALEKAGLELEADSLKYNLGFISRLELNQRKLFLEEASKQYEKAKQESYLAQKAYLLAGEGIEVR